MLPFEVWGFFVLAGIGAGWLYGSYCSVQEKARICMHLIDDLIEAKIIRMHRFQIVPGVWATRIVPWNVTQKELETTYSQPLSAGFGLPYTPLKKD